MDVPYVGVRLMKFLVISDPHFHGKNDVCRKDDVIITQFEKLKEVVELSNKYNVNIICLGDIFDSSTISYSVYAKVANILNELKNNFYFVWGNHDLLWHSLDLKSSTTLGALEISHPKVKHISELWHIDYIDWGERNIPNEGKVLCSHKAIIPKNIKDNIFWDNKDDVAILDGRFKDYKLILCGHYHKQYIVKNKNQLLINPGPLVRRNVKEINEIPSTILIDENTLKYEAIHLSCAKSSDDVISTSHLTSKETFINENLKELIETLKTSKTKSSRFRALLETAISELDKDFAKILKDILKRTFSKIEKE